MSQYLEGLTHQVLNALEAGGCTSGDLGLLIQNKQAVADFRLVLRKQAKIVSLDTQLDNHFLVYRRMTLKTPKGLIEFVNKMEHHPSTHSVDASDMCLWNYPSQEVDGDVEGDMIYHHLYTLDLLFDCVTLHYLKAIQAKGVIFFRRYFEGKRLVAWGSVGRFEKEHGEERLRVPYLFENSKGILEIGWRWLGHPFPRNYVALRLREKLI